VLHNQSLPGGYSTQGYTSGAFPVIPCLIPDLVLPAPPSRQQTDEFMSCVGLSFMRCSFIFLLGLRLYDALCLLQELLREEPQCFTSSKTRTCLVDYLFKCCEKFERSQQLAEMDADRKRFAIPCSFRRFHLSFYSLGGFSL
jgi:hypothetical protein